MTAADQELDAIAAVSEALQPLDPFARRRVLDYGAARFGRTLEPLADVLIKTYEALGAHVESNAEQRPADLALYDALLRGTKWEKHIRRAEATA